MPVRFRFFPKFNTVVCEHIGTIGDDEFLASYTSLYADDRFIPTMNHLVDLRRTDSAKRTQHTLRSFAASMNERFHKAHMKPKIAVIAPKDASFGLARMYEAYSDNIPGDFVVFRSPDAAVAWLGLPESVLDELEEGPGSSTE